MDESLKGIILLYVPVPLLYIGDVPLVSFLYIYVHILIPYLKKRILETTFLVYCLLEVTHKIDVMYDVNGCLCWRPDALCMGELTMADGGACGL